MGLLVILEAPENYGTHRDTSFSASAGKVARRRFGDMR